MKNSLKVAGWEIKKNIKSKMFLIMAFVFPVVIVAIAGASGYFTSKSQDNSVNTSLGIIDQTGILKRDLKKELTNEGYSTSFFRQKSKVEIEKIIEDKKLAAMLVFPPDSLDNNQVLFYFKDLAKDEADLFKRLLTPILAKKRLEQNGYNSKQILDLTQKPKLVFKSLKEEEGFINFMLPFGLAFMMILATMISGGMLYQSIVKEKSDRIVEITLSSITAKDLMMGKIFGYASLGIIQIVVWLTTGLLAGQYFFDLSLKSLLEIKTLYILIYFILGYLLLAGLYAMLGSAMKDSKDSNQAGGLINIIPIIPFYFSQVLMNGGDGVIVKFFTYFPIFTPVTMLLRLGVGKVSNFELIITIVMLVVFDYLIIKTAAKVFRTAILMHGQNMSFRKIFKLINS